MAKQLQFEDQARRALKRGVDMVAEAVKTTLGPRGRNVAIDAGFGAPTITHDGVAVARVITLPDPFANIGARLLVEAATRTGDRTGDGTTTATVLAQALVAEGLKLVAAGVNPMQLKRGLDRGVAVVSAALTQMATPVRDRAEIAQVATIAAGDPAIGALIAAIVERVGSEGVVTVEDGQGLNDEVAYAEGLQIAQGYSSPHFVTNAERMEADLEAPLILITDQKLAGLGPILPAIEEALAVTRSLVIVAAEIDGEALATMVINQLRGAFQILAVKAPSFGDQRQDILEDLAVLTGGTLISAAVGRTLESAALEDLGRARRVNATSETTTFIEGHGDAAALAARIAQIRAQAAATDSDFTREQLQQRLARLSGGVVVLKVGGATEAALKERRHRVEDALATARAAMAEGVVPGGGVALLNAGRALELLTPTDDERFGITILGRALAAPLQRLAVNAGLEGAVVSAEVRRGQQERGDQGYGYNVMTQAYGNLPEQGVIDPVKVTRAALESAVSVAGLLLTVEVLIADAAEEGGA